MRLHLSLLLCVGVAAGCSGSANPRVLVQVTATAPIEKYDLFVKDDDAHQPLLHAGWLDANTGGRDLSKTPLRIGLTFPHKGNYSVAVIGAIGFDMNGAPKRQFYMAQRIAAGGDGSTSLQLLEVPHDPMGTNDDVDGDLFPSAATWPMHEPGAAAIPMALLDCNDADAQVNPFVLDQCGNGTDEDCDGIDQACDDRDGDGDPDSTDCAPDDKTRHHPNPLDPAPESANCCGYALGKTGPDKLKDFKGDPACHAGTCNDGIDQDCDGVDVKCRTDGDCDNFDPGPDCDDADPTVNPLAAEVCGDQKDNNCNGLKDETCVGCDLDGDGFQRMGGGCPDGNNQHAGMIDCDDEDAGVFPGSTKIGVAVPNMNKADCGGVEGGTAACALRGACRNATPAGAPQDADCDGTPYKSCPMANDADKDGFAAGMDCDDNDPQTFPGAPDKCGDGKAQNCLGDTNCGTDGDKDGWDDTTDCNDADPAIHPWALERCNGLDDDCDGLTDEGNPDGMGNRMVANGQVLHCTDSGVGECAKGPGDCVCSSSTLKGLHFDDATRMKCPAETMQVDEGVSPAPRCYFAEQPRPDVCDGLDNDCDPATSDGTNQCPGKMPPDLVCCAPGMCTDLLADGNNCNGCGMKCPAPANSIGACVNGMCGVGSCLPGFADCNKMSADGCEIATATDVNNCGKCGMKCPGVSNATPGCSGGKCGVGACNMGFGDCDMMGGNGCEANLATDVNNCGKCGMKCSSLNSTKCVAGACDATSCATGWKNCDGNAANGCETNVLTDPLNCNACGTKCPVPANATAGCSNGMCGIGMCIPPFKDCNNMAADGCESNPATDPKNCGMCGKDCTKAPAIGLSCTAGVCTCGVGAACDPNTQVCTAGGGNCTMVTKCRKQNNQSCLLNDECGTCNCKNGNPDHCG